MEVDREELLEYLDGIKENVVRQLGWALPLSAEYFLHLSYVFWSEEENKRVLEIANEAYFKDFNLTIADVALFFPGLYWHIKHCGYVSKRLVDEEIGYFVLEAIYHPNWDDPLENDDEETVKMFRETFPVLVLLPAPFLLEDYGGGYALVDVENALPMGEDSSLKRLMFASNSDFHKWYVKQDRFWIKEESGWILDPIDPELIQEPELIRKILKDDNYESGTLDEAYEEIRSNPERLLDERQFGNRAKRIRKGFQQYLNKE